MSIFDEMDQQKDDLFETFGRATRPQQNKKLEEVAEFMEEQYNKLTTPRDVITQEIRRELENFMERSNFTVDRFPGGDAIIDVVNHNCKIVSQDAVLNGVIRFVVESYDDNGVAEISEDGYFEGCAFVWDNTEERAVFEEEILITL